MVAKREIELEIPQGITTTLYHWDDQATVFSPTHTIEALTQFWKYLYPVVQPLSADLWLDNFEAKNGYHLRINPELSMWHFQMVNPPVDRPIEPGLTPAHLERAELLTPSVIANWLSKAVDQKAAAEDMVVSIRHLAFSDTRVRLAINENEYKTVQAKIPFLFPTDKTLISEVPIEEYTGGYWVAGRTSEILYAPITVHIFNDGGVGSDLKAHITIHWSLWASSEYQEGALLQRAMDDLIKNTNWSHEETEE
jgi:hypothetical protein